MLGGRISVLQPGSGPRTGIDPLFLAAAVPAESGKAQSVLEAGLGTGVASLALCARVSGIRVTGVEVQHSLAALARENAQLNGFEERLRVVEADVTSPHAVLEREGLEAESFAHVMANPPYNTRGQGRDSERAETAQAYSAEAGSLEKWVKFLARMTRPGGTVTLIHRPEALDELLALLGGRFGTLKVFPLFPREGAAAKRVLVQGVKGSRAPLELLPGMVLHGGDGGYTPEVDAVLRGAAALPLRQAPR